MNVSGLPRSASWQDLKDYMRKAGDVVYADVDGRGDGVVEFSNPDDMEAAVRKLDDTEFKNPFDRSYIRVRFANKSGDERSPSRSRSRSRDRSMSKSPSRSRSRSPDRKRSYSRSPSPDDQGKDVNDRGEDDRDDDRDRDSAPQPSDKEGDAAPSEMKEENEDTNGREEE